MYHSSESYENQSGILYHSSDSYIFLNDYNRFLNDYLIILSESGIVVNDLTGAKSLTIVLLSDGFFKCPDDLLKYQFVLFLMYKIIASLDVNRIVYKKNSSDNHTNMEEVI